MKDFCRFLRSDPAAHQSQCVAGINFVSVGQGRALCRACPLAELGDLPLCPNADVYIYLRRGHSEAAEIEVRFGCGVSDAAQDPIRCAGCPACVQVHLEPSVMPA